MRREPEFFGEQELVLIYMARRLKEAFAVEKALDAGAVDYAVVPAPYLSGLLFPFQRIGAFFYAAPEAESHARALIQEHGFKPVRTGAKSTRAALKGSPDASLPSGKP